MPKSSFLFVPYRGGATNLAPSGASSADARSHAAVVSRQRREDSARHSAQLVANKSTPSQSIVRRTGNETDESSSPTRSHFSDGSESPDGDCAQVEQPASLVKRRQRMRTMQFSWRAGSLNSDARLSNGWRADPFGNQDVFHDRVVDYYAQVITPVNHPIYAIFDVTNVYTSFYLELLRNEDYMPAGLAMVGAIMQGLSQPGRKVSEEVRLNQAKAVSRLHDKVKLAKSNNTNPVDDIAIITVLALASLSRLLGDTAAYQAHRQNMAKMVASRGGLNSLGYEGLVKCLLMQWDSFWVFQTEGSSLFPHDRLGQHPIYPAWPLSNDLQNIFAKLPLGFQTLVLRGKISVELMETLGRAAEVAKGGITAIDNGSMYQSRRKTNHDFVEACPCLGIPDGETPNLEKQLTLALLLYCANAFTTARSSTALYAAARIELTRLLLTGSNEWSILPEEECAFWVCVVCVDSWRETDSKAQLLPTGLRLLPILQAQPSSKIAKQVLGKFFSGEEFLDGCQNYLKMPV